MKLHRSLSRFITLGLLLIGLLFATPLMVYGQGGDPPSLDLPKLDIVIIVDESASMWKDTDVRGEENGELAPPQRVHAFNLLIDTLGAYDTAQGDRVRVSVVAFGSAELTRRVLDFTEVNADTVQFIKDIYQTYNDELANPNRDVVGLGWTDALHALEVAEQILTDPANGHRLDHKPAIIILSDGKPETEEIHEGVDDFAAKRDDYINRTLSQAAKFQSPAGGQFFYEGTCPPLKLGWVPIYTIAVRKATSEFLPNEYKDIWRRLAEQNGGSYYADAEGKSLGEWGGNYYRIWSHLICQTDELESGRAPLTRTYTVTNLYKTIIFTVLKDTPEINVEIYRPKSNTPIPQDDPTVNRNASLLDEVWSIERSEERWAGTWTVKLTGEGDVWFNYKLFTDLVQVDQISPKSSFVKACNPIDLELKITNSAQVPITPNIEAFRLTIERPDGQTIPLGDIPPENDIYHYPYADTCLDGEYKFSGMFLIKGQIDEETVTEFPWNTTIRSSLDPYLDIVSPLGSGQYYTGHPVPLQVDVKAGQTLAEAIATQNPPVEAKVYQGTNLVAGPFRLTYAGTLGPARLKSEIPLNHQLSAGSYTVEFFIEQLGDNPEPEIQRAVFTLTTATAPILPPTPTFTPVPPTPTPGPTIKPPISCLLLACILLSLLLLGVIGGGGAWWYRQQPSMLPLLLAGPYSSHNIRGKFPKTIPFMATNNQKIKLQFSPASDYEQAATEVTLLSDLDGTPVKIDNFPLSNKGDGIVITDQSHQRLIVGEDIYDITY